MKPAVVFLISRGLRWQALQVEEKICAADLPASMFDWACAGAAETHTAMPTSQGTIAPTRNTSTPPKTVRYRTVLRIAGNRGLCFNPRVQNGIRPTGAVAICIVAN